ncbi:uncharacterized protein LOC118193436 [Stegodyphus dumicola]|uniref:uncharacterized protein LOC118193436 n=1 Tax=Stegodyphus dumicola TaxID=202533 RepID=UPI0015ACF1BB|nr:uncharacterized protein LOC118193436 [Stegodyphus dumicola]
MKKLKAAKGSIKTKEEVVLEEKIHLCQPDTAHSLVKKQTFVAKMRAKEENVPLSQIYNEEVGKLYNQGFDILTNIPQFSSVKTALYKSRQSAEGYDREATCMEDLEIPNELLAMDDNFSFFLFDERCLSPRSRYFYEPCPFPAVDSNNSNAEPTTEQNKKKGPLCRLFRSLGPKKDREKVSPRHKCAKPQHEHQLNVKYLAEGSRLQIGDIGGPGSEDDQVRLLLQLVRDGFLSMEDAMDRIQPKEVEKINDITVLEKIEDCPNRLEP